MNIYHITRKDVVYGSQIKEAVIIASSELSAREMAQNKFNVLNNEVQFPKDQFVNCRVIGVSVIDNEDVLMSVFTEGVLDI